MHFTFKKFMLIAGLLLLLVFGWFTWQFFGPNPKVIVSRNTTCLIEPLAADGLPNYAEAIRQRQCVGVTPENNGAVPFWQALWPGPDYAEIGDEDRSLLAAELRIDPISLDTGQRLHSPTDEPVLAKIADWLKSEMATPAGVENERQSTDNDEQSAVAESFDDIERRLEEKTAIEDQSLDVAYYAMSAPWNSKTIPPLASWVQENNRQLDLLIEASQRPEWYLPSIALLNSERWAISNGFGMDMANYGSFRAAARALSCRAMWHLGEGRLTEAWRDIFAMHQLSQRCAEGELIVTQLVAIAVSGIAVRATEQLLDYEELPPELAGKILEDLRSIKSFDGIWRSLQGGERFFVLEPLLALSLDQENALTDPSSFYEGWVASAFEHATVDVNLMLANVNEAFDSLTASAKHPTALQREPTLNLTENRINQLTSSPTAVDFMAGALSRSARSRVLAGRIIDNFLPAFNAGLDAQDRANATLELVRLAAALAVYRAEYGNYPETLEALVPEIIPSLSTDCFQEVPFVYRRTSNGYLLYSCGQNGKNDGGNNHLLSTYRGYVVEPESAKSVRHLLGDEVPREAKAIDVTKRNAIESDDPSECAAENDPILDHVPEDADDIAIRLPLPKTELPKEN